MELQVILVVFIVAAVVFAVSGGYLFVKCGIINEIPKLINLAQRFADKSGPEKMDYVVVVLYAKIPAVFRKVLTQEQLRVIAQNIYDDIREYAEKKIHDLSNSQAAK